MRPRRAGPDREMLSLDERLRLVRRRRRTTLARLVVTSVTCAAALLVLTVAVAGLTIASR
jgi:hypothetical protein